MQDGERVPIGWYTLGRDTLMKKAEEAAQKLATDAAADAANKDVYGELPLVQSQVITGRVWHR